MGDLSVFGVRTSRAQHNNGRGTVIFLLTLAGPGTRRDNSTMSSTGQSSSSIYLVSDPRMERHRPVPPPAGQTQHRQLDPPCERPERLARIMERLRRLERSLIGLRGGGRETATSAAASVASVPFVKSNCRPVSRETGEFSCDADVCSANAWPIMERGAYVYSCCYMYCCYMYLASC